MAVALEPDQCYRAVASRDARFDGWFIVGVTSTGIYCRPSCPTPIRPKRENTRFFATAAAAQRAGFRACKRCRPDASPGSPQWDVRADLVGRAMRLIADGVVDRDGVGGLAARLAVSERQLHRVLADDVGAGPLAIARAYRAQTARILIETTDMRFTDVAFAAGFSSVRQFNDTIREVFAQTPRDLRAKASSTAPTEPGEVVVRLPYRPPIASEQLLAWMRLRTIAGLSVVEDDVIVRSLRLPRGAGLVRLRFDDGFVQCALRLDDIADLATAVERCRRLLDLDVDPLVVDAALGADPALAPLVRARPGMRAAGSTDGFESAVFAILGQQISVRAACALAGRLVARFGSPVNGSGYSAFPAPGALVDADLGELGMTARTQAAIKTVAGLVVDGLTLDPGADRAEARNALLSVKGIGPWTADYIAIRAMRDPDVLPVGDLIVRRNAEAHGLPSVADDLAAHGTRWAPWRTYVTHHLWAAGAAQEDPS